MPYPNPFFVENRAEVLHEAIRAIAFGTLLTHAEDGFAVTHLPFELDAQPTPNGTLIGHIARSNPQWRGIADDGVPALAIFQGPHGYVSPSWYPGKRDDPRQVPTWDYVAVHAHGTLRTFDEPAKLLDLLTRLTERNERGRAQPWHVTDAPDDYVREQMRYIIGLELQIEKLQGRYKLSQNRDAADQEGARANLAAASSERERDLAEAIAQTRARTPR